MESKWMAVVFLTRYFLLKSEFFKLNSDEHKAYINLIFLRIIKIPNVIWNGILNSDFNLSVRLRSLIWKSLWLNLEAVTDIRNEIFEKYITILLACILFKTSYIHSSQEMSHCLMNILDMSNTFCLTLCLFWDIGHAISENQIGWYLNVITLFLVRL